jgi:serine/threonine protein kinase
VFGIFPFYDKDLEFVLDDYYAKKITLPPDVTQRIMRSILLGVKHLHSLEIVHRRLRPGIILLNDIRSNIVIGGFTHARSLGSPPLDTIALHGSRRFISFDCAAPELLYLTSDRQRLASWKPIDMWSIGYSIALLVDALSCSSSRTVRSSNVD